jgi:hypothetical protein
LIEFPHELLLPLIDTLHQSYGFIADADHTVLFGWRDGWAPQNAA